MRLYLSSFALEKRTDRLVALARHGAAVSVVMNAMDNFPRAREEWLANQTETLRSLGFVPEELDLRDYFGSAERLTAALAGKGLLWINGGNSFLLRRAMRQSGFDSVVRGLLASDEIVYGGFSAAVCCAGPTLRGVELVDDANALSAGYASETVWDGLGLIDHSVAVHYRSGSAESKRIERTIAYWKSQNMPYRTLRDGEALVIDGDRSEVVS